MVWLLWQASREGSRVSGYTVAPPPDGIQNTAHGNAGRCAEGVWGQSSDMDRAENQLQHVVEHWRCTCRPGQRDSLRAYTTFVQLVNTTAASWQASESRRCVHSSLVAVCELACHSHLISRCASKVTWLYKPTAANNPTTFKFTVWAILSTVHCSDIAGRRSKQLRSTFYRTITLQVPGSSLIFLAHGTRTLTQIFFQELTTLWYSKMCLLGTSLVMLADPPHVELFNTAECWSLLSSGEPAQINQTAMLIDWNS